MSGLTAPHLQTHFYVLSSTDHAFMFPSFHKYRRAINEFSRISVSPSSRAEQYAESKHSRDDEFAGSVGAQAKKVSKAAAPVKENIRSINIRLFFNSLR